MVAPYLSIETCQSQGLFPTLIDKVGVERRCTASREGCRAPGASSESSSSAHMIHDRSKFLQKQNAGPAILYEKSMKLGNEATRLEHDFVHDRI